MTITDSGLLALVLVGLACSSGTSVLVLVEAGSIERVFVTVGFATSTSVGGGGGAAMGCSGGGAAAGGFCSLAGVVVGWFGGIDLV